VLEVIGRRTSGNVMKVLWAADELGVAYTQRDVGGPFGGNDAPAFRALNPNGLVPVVVDDGVVIWESNAIVRYLAARYGSGTLCPADLGARAIADQWMDWQQTTVGPMITPIFWGLVRTPPEKRDEAAIARAIRTGYQVWGVLDAHLARHRFVAGSDFSMGDIPLGPHAHRWFNLVADRPPMPHLEAWYGRLTERPAFRRHCMNPIV
jgi:glutathione S-transferase